MSDDRRREEMNEEERTTQDMRLEEQPTVPAEEEARTELAPEVWAAFGTVLRSMEKLARLVSERDALKAGPVSYTFVRALEERSHGLQLLLFARHLRHGPAGYVVVKRLRNPASLERGLRLREEVHLAFLLHHPAIAQVHHFLISGNKPHVVMEYVDGPLMETLLDAAALRGAPLPVPFALYVVAEVADALHYAHTLTEQEEGGRPLGIIHRDVSPRNIRISRRSGAVKLTDFGAAYSKRIGREETAGRLVKGDVLFASPEYLHGEPMDARSDIFSLGLVLLEALTSQHLFDLADMTEEEAQCVELRAEEKPSVPLARMMARVDRYGPEDVERVALDLRPELKAIVHQALRRAPAERYATAADLLREVRAVLVALAPGYGRKEAAADVERLLSEASALRDVVEPVEGGLYPEGLEEHELSLEKRGSV
jgi:eukaryotic-like serine/threonine-protein kinase